MFGKQSSFFRIDEQVVYTMLAVCIISIIVFAFRFISDKPCTGVSMAFGQDSVFVNEIVHFRTNANTGESYSWNFGDGNAEDKGSSSINHSYKEARTYTVKLVMDDHCTDIHNLVVYDRKGEVNPAFGPLYVAPRTAYVGDNVRFSDSASTSTSWEWYMDDNPEIYSRERVVWYSFKKSGTKKIVLKVNKNSGVSVTNFINILDKPVDNPVAEKPNKTLPPERNQLPNIIATDAPSNTPLTPEIKESEKAVVPAPAVPEVVPEATKAPDLNDDQLESALMTVAEGKKTAQDFTEYLCGNLDIKVQYDNKKYSFIEFCDKLKYFSEKRIKKITVTTIKNPSNCILGLQVSIKKKGIW